MKLYEACSKSNVRRAVCEKPLPVFGLLRVVELWDLDFYPVGNDGVRQEEPVCGITLCNLLLSNAWEPVAATHASDGTGGKPIHWLNDLRDDVHKLAEEKGWHENFDLAVRGPKFDKDYNGVAGVMHVAGCLANIHGEVSEALECLRTDGMDDISLVDAPANGAKPEGFAIELADVLIRVLDLCGLLGIDIDDAVRRKHEYNKTRPYRHGGKAL